MKWKIVRTIDFLLLDEINSFPETFKMSTTVKLKTIGCCEIIGVFCGLLLILYTKRKWLYTGVFNIVAGFIAYSAWLIPLDSKFHLFLSFIFDLMRTFGFSLVKQIAYMIHFYSWYQFESDPIDVIVNDLKSCDFISTFYSNNLHHWIGLCREEKNLCIFHDCLCTNLATMWTFHRCNCVWFATVTANFVHYIINYRRHSQYIN